MVERGCVVLTGGPGAGKSTVARLVAQRLSRCAVVEVDDVRQMLVKPHAAPWAGEEGQRQQMLGVRNACALVRNFRADGSDVVVPDVVTNESAGLYRAEIAGVRIVQLLVRVETAIERARRRHYSLTEEEMQHLHAGQAAFMDADLRLDTEELGLDGLAERIQTLLP